jgi:hypothetical protein
MPRVSNHEGAEIRSNGEMPADDREPTIIDEKVAR